MRLFWEFDGPPLLLFEKTSLMYLFTYFFSRMNWGGRVSTYLLEKQQPGHQHILPQYENSQLILATTFTLICAWGLHHDAPCHDLLSKVLTTDLSPLKFLIMSLSTPWVNPWKIGQLSSLHTIQEVLFICSQLNLWTCQKLTSCVKEMISYSCPDGGGDASYFFSHP